ncbi:MAG: hypothetical protein ABMA64_31830 [Myxococcota bacterium]
MDLDWLEELLSDTRASVMELLTLPMEDVDALILQVRDRRRSIYEGAKPLTDLALADALSEATVDLLQRTAAREDHRRLAAVAARYFASDPGGDLASPYGFDDDVEVFNAIAVRLAPELVLTDR